MFFPANFRVGFSLEFLDSFLVGWRINGEIYEIMGRLAYFWVDLAGTCVDLTDMILWRYGGKIANNWASRFISRGFLEYA